MIGHDGGAWTDPNDDVAKAEDAPGLADFDDSGVMPPGGQEPNWADLRALLMDGKGPVHDASENLDTRHGDASGWPWRHIGENGSRRYLPDFKRDALGGLPPPPGYTDTSEDGQGASVFDKNDVDDGSRAAAAQSNANPFGKLAPMESTDRSHDEQPNHPMHAHANNAGSMESMPPAGNNPIKASELWDGEFRGQSLELFFERYLRESEAETPGDNGMMPSNGNPPNGGKQGAAPSSQDWLPLAHSEDPNEGAEGSVRGVKPANMMKLRAIINGILSTEPVRFMTEINQDLLSHDLDGKHVKLNGKSLMWYVQTPKLDIVNSMFKVLFATIDNFDTRTKMYKVVCVYNKKMQNLQDANRNKETEITITPLQRQMTAILTNVAGPEVIRGIQNYFCVHFLRFALTFIMMSPMCESKLSLNLVGLYMSWEKGMIEIRKRGGKYDSVQKMHAYVIDELKSITGPQIFDRLWLSVIRHSAVSAVEVKTLSRRGSGARRHKAAIEGSLSKRPSSSYEGGVPLTGAAPKRQKGFFNLNDPNSLARCTHVAQALRINREGGPKIKQEEKTVEMMADKPVGRLSPASNPSIPSSNSMERARQSQAVIRAQQALASTEDESSHGQSGENVCSDKSWNEKISMTSDETMVGANAGRSHSHETFSPVALQAMREKLGLGSKKQKRMAGGEAMKEGILDILSISAKSTVIDSLSTFFVTEAARSFHVELSFKETEKIAQSIKRSVERQCRKKQIEDSKVDSPRTSQCAPLSPLSGSLPARISATLANERKKSKAKGSGEEQDFICGVTRRACQTDRTACVEENKKTE